MKEIISTHIIIWVIWFGGGWMCDKAYSSWLAKQQPQIICINVDTGEQTEVIIQEN